MRVGFGYDVHRLKKGETLILGGEKIVYEKGLVGHSDADVVIHAVMDALLGASGQGDIGVHFPDNEPGWKDISSLYLLEKVKILLDKKKFLVSNIDLTVVIEKPKISIYYDKMKKNIAMILKMPKDNINIKASTNEGIGFIGQEEGIATFCVALLEKIT
ncbi:MAG TPA: 2-C-methyl-D-erythritol 2,4-cyclodiphosphate synthase [Atribacterota bacterium]|nr:2-C-methyl-D-erythritol 2,4-cyclodiphosphate synthase [Atribacterota bacterium]